MNDALIPERLEREYGFSGGPAELFWQIGRHTLIMLLRQGMTPSSSVLDYGCGTMRLGYWIMRLLDEGNYYAIEPNEKHLDAGKDIVIGEKLLSKKRPHFSGRGDFTLDVFNHQFDFVVARSIFTHFNPAAIDKVLSSLPKSLAPGGCLLASFWQPEMIGGVVENGEALAGENPRADINVAYSFEYLAGLADKYGLSSEKLSPVVNDQPWIKFKVL